MKRISLFLFFIGFLLAACSGPSSSQATSGGIEIKNVWARPAAMMDMASDSSGNMNSGEMSGSNGAAYLTIVNNGNSADRLDKVESTIAGSTELHQSVMKDNVMSMVPVDGIDVPAKGRVDLKPGGYHIMLVGIKQDLKLGDKIHLTLVFEKAGKIEVDADVKQP
jgi:periplasmic copper chaperone A